MHMCTHDNTSLVSYNITQDKKVILLDNTYYSLYLYMFRTEGIKK